MFAKIQRLKNLNAIKTALTISAALGLVGCDKGGGSFTILSDSTQFKQQTTFTPRKLDVLFVVDNSGSMLTSQNNLAANFSSFIDKFIAKGYDFKIAVTTTDAFYGDQFLSTSCSLCNTEQARFKSGTNPKIYTLDKNNYDLSNSSEIQKLKDIFSANVKVGTSGSGDERAFSSFKAALSSNLNTGFHRSDAFLAIVIVSDEEDFSQNNYTMNESYSNSALHSVLSYKQFLDGFTAGSASNDYSVSTISITNELCRSNLAKGSGAQKIGQRYMDLALLTGGTQTSICEPFDQSLDNISTQIITQAKPIYTLTKKPLVSTLQVIIDGVVVPKSDTDGWSYQSSVNTLSINGLTYKPHAGSDIVINFDPDLTQL